MHNQDSYLPLKSKKRLPSSLSLKTTLVFSVALVIMIILLLTIFFTIKRSNSYKNDYVLVNSKIITKEQEKNSLQHAIMEQQQASMKYIQDNKIKQNELEEIKKKIEKVDTSQPDNSMSSSNVYYQLYLNNQRKPNTILKENEFMFILTLFPFWKIKLQIAYKASIDGDGVRDFMQLCKGIKKQLLVVMRLENDEMIGAYTMKPNWNMDDQVPSRDESFLFNVNGKRKYPIQENMRGMIIEDHRFRYDDDLIIYDGYLHGLKAKSSFNDSPPNMDRLSYNSLTNGLTDFAIKDIEAFEVVILNEYTDDSFMHKEN